MRFREVKELTQAHTAGKWQNWGFKEGLLDFELWASQHRQLSYSTGLVSCWDPRSLVNICRLFHLELRSTTCLTKESTLLKNQESSCHSSRIFWFLRSPSSGQRDVLGSLCCSGTRKNRGHLYWLVWAATTKYHRPGGLNNRNLSSQFWSPEVQGLSTSKADFWWVSLHDWKMAACLQCPHMAFPLYASAERERDL